MASKLLEVCIDNLASGLEAERGGAGRIELCSSLAEGGLTPSAGFLKVAKSAFRIPVFAMIRPRGGDFLYSDAEIGIMKEDIRILKEIGADGFVFGALNKNGSINEEANVGLLAAVGPLPSTFHRAFDLIPDPKAGLETLIRLGFQRVLTSGQEPTALAGIGLIRSLVEQGRDRIQIMAGAGLTPDNISALLEAGQVTEVHGSCRSRVRSEMELMSGKAVSMGTSHDEMNILVTDRKVVERIVHQF